LIVFFVVYTYDARSNKYQISLKKLSTTCHSITKFFFHGASAPRGLGPPHYRGFTITFS